MRINVDLRSSTPIYLQIVEQIHTNLENGDLKKGDQLPTVRQLAADLRINFNTVARAYRILDESGLISTQHGRGTYIWETLTEKSKEELQNNRLRNLTEDFIATSANDGHSADEILAMVDEMIKQKFKREMDGERKE